MRPRISILDATQTLIGPAIALVQAGFEVRYFAPDIRARTTPGYRQAMLDRYLRGGDPEPCFEADRVVYAESFSDGWWALLGGHQLDAPVQAGDPLAASIHPLQMELRLDALRPGLEACRDLVVVDMSDLAEPLHPGFLALPGAKLKREVLPAMLALGIAPFPFLYNPFLLSFDFAIGLDGCRVPPGPPVWDGWFCGTIDHPRYGGSRQAALEVLVARHPEAHFGIFGGNIDTYENLRQVQRARTMLHPPGRGTLCFRTHEALRFGLPMLCAELPAVVLPAPLRRCFVRDLADELPSRAEVLDLYARHYAPDAAARALQDITPAPTYDRPLATNLT